MLSDPFLPRGRDMDLESTGLLLNSQIPQRKDKKLGKLEMRCPAMQYQQPPIVASHLKEIILHLVACKKECSFYREHGKRFRRKHLEERKRAAQDNNDKEAFANISTIIQREHQQDFWRRLNYVTGKKKTQSATTIQVECQGGAIVERTTQDMVEQTIFSEIHDKRYTLAGEAPICNGELFHDFGYLANTPASGAVLDGTYEMPTTSDTATAELFAEIAAIRALIPKDSVLITITPSQWKQYWKVVNEETSSSESGLHFGHYKVGGMSDIVAHYDAAQVTVTLAHAVQLERWTRGLSVMLKKTLRVTLVSKLRAILLMEADFNATNKIVYGNRMMKTFAGSTECRKRSLARRTGQRMMALCAKHFSTTSRGRLGCRQLLHQSMPLIATTE